MGHNIIRLGESQRQRALVINRPPLCVAILAWGTQNTKVFTLKQKIRAYIRKESLMWSARKYFCGGIFIKITAASTHLSLDGDMQVLSARLRSTIIGRSSQPFDPNEPLV
jgi:hypothetical protein